MGGWNATGGGWQMRREREGGLPQVAGRWTAPDVGITIVAFLVHWEFGLAFVALKLWQQASGYPGSVFSFVREKWERLVGMTRSLMSGVSMPATSWSSRTWSAPWSVRSSGNHAFDDWRRTELDRIEAERSKLRAAEREFTAYRDELLHAKDREDFERFMQARGNDKSGDYKPAG